MLMYVIAFGFVVFVLAVGSGVWTWSDISCAVSGVGFDLVAQDEIGAGVAGFGGGEVFT